MAEDAVITIKKSNLNKDLNKLQQNIKSKISLLIVAGIIIYLIFESVAIIGAGERGVLLQFGRPVIILDEGLNFKIPIVNTVKILDIKTLKYETESSAASKDLQDVKTKVALNYHLDATKVIDLYRTLGSNKVIEQTIISPAVQESVKASTALFNAEELITERAKVKSKIEDILRGRLTERGLFVETLSITDFQFSPEFANAIEQKQVATQLVLKAQRDLDRIKIEAEQVRTAAQGDADAKLIKAKAEAQAIIVQGEALRTNPEIIELREIEKWDGVLPKISGGDIPFILDIKQLDAASTSK